MKPWASFINAAAIFSGSIPCFQPNPTSRFARVCERRFLTLTASCHLTAWIHLCTFARRSRRFGRTKNGKNTQRNDSVVGKRGTGCMGHRRGPQGFHSRHNCNVELISPTGDTLDPSEGAGLRLKPLNVFWIGQICYICVFPIFSITFLPCIIEISLSVPVLMAPAGHAPSQAVFNFFFKRSIHMLHRVSFPISSKAGAPKGQTWRHV